MGQLVPGARIGIIRTLSQVWVPWEHGIISLIAKLGPMGPLGAMELKGLTIWNYMAQLAQWDLQGIKLYTTKESNGTTVPYKNTALEHLGSIKQDLFHGTKLGSMEPSWSKWNQARLYGTKVGSIQLRQVYWNQAGFGGIAEFNGTTSPVPELEKFRHMINLAKFTDQMNKNRRNCYTVSSICILFGGKIVDNKHYFKLGIMNFTFGQFVLQ